MQIQRIIISGKNKINYPRLAIDMHNYIIQVSIRLFHKNLRVKIKSKIISNNVSFLEKYNYKTCFIKQIYLTKVTWEDTSLCPAYQRTMLRSDNILSFHHFFLVIYNFYFDQKQCKFDIIFLVTIHTCLYTFFYHIISNTEIKRRRKKISYSSD